MTTNYEWLLHMNGEERQAWFDAKHVDAHSKAQSKTEPKLSELFGILSDANDDLPHENDVSAKDMDANDENATCNNSGDFVTDDSREKLEADMASILHSAYMYAWMHGHENRRGGSFSHIHREFFNMLDRQAAITERELCEGCDYKRANERQARKIHNVCEQNAELQAKADSLVAENGDRVWHEPLSSARSDGSEPAADADEVADYVRKMDALLCRLTNGKFSKSWAYDVDFMESCVNEEFEALYDEEVGELRDRVGRLTAERDSLASDLAESERLREQLREKLGVALDHAHDMLALVDLDGNVVDRGLA